MYPLTYNHPWGRFTAAVLALALVLVESASENDLGIKQRSFADGLAALLHKNDNDCTSSWGVSMMFSLLYPGSEGNTMAEICDVLGFPCDSQLLLPWNDTAHKLAGKYDGRCEFYENGGSDGPCASKVPLLEVANSVWIDNGTTLMSSYHNVVGGYVLQTDFQDEGAGGVVNDWVDDSTHGLIDSIMDEGKIEFDLVAINSIYLNASWAEPFKEEFTNEDSFYTDAARETSLASKAHFMHMVDSFPYSHDALPGYQIINLPFAASSLSMIIVLPLNVASSSVTSSDVLSVLPDLEKTQLALAMPKFQFASEYEDDLMSALKSLGLTDAFDWEKGFCRMFEGNCAFLELIKQKTFIEVHEKGTEAAAVTMGGMTLTSGNVGPPPVPTLFLADHPFQFFIYDQEEDLVVFEGRVGAPDIPEGFSQAELQSKHSENDFWSSTFGVDPTVPSRGADVTEVPTISTPTASPGTQEPTILAPTASSVDDTAKPTHAPQGGITLPPVGGTDKGEDDPTDAPTAVPTDLPSDATDPASGASSLLAIVGATTFWAVGALLLL